MSHVLQIAVRIVSAAVCVTLVAERPALAQTTNPRRPSGGLFGATRSDVNQPERLTVTFEVAEGYDSELPLERDAAVVGGNLSSGGFSTVFGASSSFNQGGRRLQFGASVSTAWKYYQELDRLDALSHGAGVGMGLRLPKGGRFQINGSLAYSPSYLYQLFPQSGEPPALGESIPLNPDYRIDQTDTYSSLSRATLEFGSPGATIFAMLAEYRVTEYQDQTLARSGLETSSYGTNVSHALSRSFSFRAGYKYRTGEIAFSGPSYEHEVPIGFSYSPALSASRRLAIRVHIAPAWLKFTPSALEIAVTEPIPDYFYRLQGNAGINYPFKLNWNAEATYDRSVQYVMGLSEPLLSDSVRAGVTGLVSRRIDVRGVVGYARAESPYSGIRQQLDTYTGGMKVRYALNRSVALYSEYLYYYYDQGGLISLVPGLPRVFEQHGVRLGVSMFADALGR